MGRMWRQGALTPRQGEHGMKVGSGLLRRERRKPLPRLDHKLYHHVLVDPGCIHSMVPRNRFASGCDPERRFALIED